MSDAASEIGEGVKKFISFLTSGLEFRLTFVDIAKGTTANFLDHLVLAVDNHGHWCSSCHCLCLLEKLLMKS
jgi:hypothetical protein